MRSAAVRHRKWAIDHVSAAPMKRRTTPGEVVSAAVLLVFDADSYITGQVIIFGGGGTLR